MLQGGKHELVCYGNYALLDLRILMVLPRRVHAFIGRDSWLRKENTARRRAHRSVPPVVRLARQDRRKGGSLRIPWGVQPRRQFRYGAKASLESVRHDAGRLSAWVNVTARLN